MHSSPNAGRLDNLRLLIAGLANRSNAALSAEDARELMDEVDRCAALVESEAKAGRDERRFLRKIIDTVPSLIFVKDAEGRFVLANRAMADCYGTTVDGMEGKTDADFNSNADEVARFRSDDREVLAQRHEKLIAEEIVTDANGQGHWLSTVKVPVIDDDGKCGHVLGVATDVTERKQAEERLRMTQFSVDRAGDGVFWIDRTGRVMYVNDAACSSLGYGREELLRMTVPDFDPLFPAQQWAAHWAELRQRGSFSFESLHRRKSGETFPVEITVNYLRYAGAEYNCAFSRDITERRRAQQQLLEHNEFLHTVIESLTHPFYVIDANDYSISLANSAAGLGEIGPHTTCYSLTHHSPVPCHETGVACPLAQVKASGKPAIVEHVHYDGAGQPHTYEVHAYPLFDSAGQVSKIIEYSLDVTETRKAQEELRLNEQRLREAHAAKDQFLAMLSHELRTPLTPVLAAATIMEKDRRLPADALEQLKMVRRNVELEARLIDDLLDLTRISRGKLELRWEIVDLVSVLRHAIETCSAEIDAKDLHLAFKPCGESCRVKGDAARLQQVLWNLMKNSIKFTPDGGRIDVRCSAHAESEVLIEVSDSGVGIEPDLLPRIFDAFEQGGRNVTRQFGGLGLGLTISRASSSSTTARSKRTAKAKARERRSPSSCPWSVASCQQERPSLHWQRATRHWQLTA